MYAKIIDNQLEYAPKNKGSISNYNLNIEMMKADGYKLVNEYTLNENQYIMGWEEIDGVINPIIQTINVVEYDSERQLMLNKVSELKHKLSETDYITCKLVEAIDEEEFNSLKEIYAETIAQRREWRTEIDALLKELN